jgi:hypothetical protein
MTGRIRGKWVLSYKVGGREEKAETRRRRKNKKKKKRGSHHERRWTMSLWPGETASIWGTLLGRQPGQQLEKYLRGYSPVIIKAK